MAARPGHTALPLRYRFGSDPRITFRLMEVTPTLGGWRFAKEHGFGAVAEFGFWVENIDQLLSSGSPVRTSRWTTAPA